MTPVYRAALGSDFDRLHPNLQWRYGIDSTSGVAQIMTGLLESVYVTAHAAAAGGVVLRQAQRDPVEDQPHAPVPGGELLLQVLKR